VAIQILIDVGSHLVARLGLGAPETSQDLLQRLEHAGKLPAGASKRFGRIFAFRNRIVHLYDRAITAMRGALGSPTAADTGPDVRSG
jgi:uncharacterized protein YutE (UPF0331/DUF86 family)